MNIQLQPEVLRWVRERAGLSRNQLADGLRVDQSRVSRWEQTGEITFAMAERVARKTHAPIGYLYLSAPLEEALPIQDFRSATNVRHVPPSAELRDVLYEAQLRQDWYRTNLLNEDAERLDFVATVRANDDPESVAKKIRERFGLQTQIRANATSWDDALRLHIEQVEDAGVLVTRSGVAAGNNRRPLSVHEFRGFALSDEIAPLIFINSADAKAAQIFTLVHELVHIWLGVSGISNLEKTYAPDERTERFCNSVAAEVLLPIDELLINWREVRQGPDPFGRLSRRFKISTLVVLRRLRDAAILSSREFNAFYNEHEARFLRAQSRSSGGGDYYATQKARVGSRLAKALVASTLEGKTTYRDALRLLGLSRIDTFRRFARELDFKI